MVITKSPEYITPEAESVDRSRAEPVAAQSHDMSELKVFARALLHHIVYGNNSAGKGRLLRALYWNAVKTLADLDDHRNRS